MPCVQCCCGSFACRPVQASYASVITAGDPVQAKPPIPLENLPAGTFDPLYRLPLDLQNGELPVLPLSIAGAVSMTHLPDTEAYLSGDEWFIFKFDKQQAGLSGEQQKGRQGHSWGLYQPQSAVPAMAPFPCSSYPPVW